MDDQDEIVKTLHLRAAGGASALEAQARKFERMGWRWAAAECRESATALQFIRTATDDHETLADRFAPPTT